MHLYGHTPEMLKTTINTVCYSKSRDWEYEREWRMVTWRVKQSRLFSFYSFDAAELESVTFGAKIAGETEEQVREVVKAKYRGCSLYRIKVSLGEAVRVPADLN